MLPATMIRHLCKTATLVPVLFVLTLFAAYVILMDDSSSFRPFAQTSSSSFSSSPSHFIYTALPGYFLQSKPSTPDQTFNLTTTNFGLIHRIYDSDPTFIDKNPSTNPSASDWPRFLNHLTKLNANSPKSTSYRLLFLSRHGQGYHNVAESFFGTRKWDCYYSTLNGTSNLTWADAHLTPLGIQQAEAMRQFWSSQVRDMGMQWPSTYYTSPLDRAVTTTGIVFADAHITIKELLREGIGIHTCDRRSTRSAITSRHLPPRFTFESGFVEEDMLWRPDLREPGAAQTVRLTALLDDVLQRDESITISLTSHGGTISSILRAVGHREFYVETGGVVPVLVKVDKVDGERPKGEDIPWIGKPDCEDGDKMAREVDAKDDLRRLDEHVKGLLP